MADDENFERLGSLDGLTSKMYVDAVYDDREGFRIILRANEPKARPLRIRFDSPICYRAAHEAYLLKQIYEAHDIYPWPLFIVHNSRYARWFYAQASGAIHRDGHHYHVAAMDEIVDIISTHPPSLAWLPDT